MKLYKFKSLEGNSFLHSLDMIVNERIYLSTCDFLNDPYEGGWEKSESLAFLLSNNMDDYLDKAGELRSIVDNTRFTSFTKDYNNELLWAHYSGGFSGVCFEYEISQDEHDIRHINYDGTPDISREDIQKVLNKKINPQDIGILKSKAKCWEYEDEYRLYQSEYSNDEYIHAKPTRVIFGIKKLKYDNVFNQIVKKYGIQVSYLQRVDNEHVAYDI